MLTATTLVPQPLDPRLLTQGAEGLVGHPRTRNGDREGDLVIEVAVVLVAFRL